MIAKDPLSFEILERRLDSLRTSVDAATRREKAVRWGNIGSGAVLYAAIFQRFSVAEFALISVIALLVNVALFEIRWRMK